MKIEVITEKSLKKHLRCKVREDEYGSMVYDVYYKNSKVDSFTGLDDLKGVIVKYVIFTHGKRLIGSKRKEASDFIKM